MRRSTRSRLLVLAAIALMFGADPPFARALPGGTIAYPPGWNLIGGPAGTRLLGSQGDLYTLQFRDDGYRPVSDGTALTGGLGYWAYFPSGGSADLSASGPCVIAVPIGARSWVIVGNPWSSGTASVRGAERVYVYDPVTGYRSSTTVPAGHAALAYSSVATSAAVVVDGCATADREPPSEPVRPSN